MDSATSRKRVVIALLSTLILSLSFQPASASLIPLSDAELSDISAQGFSDDIVKMDPSDLNQNLGEISQTIARKLADDIQFRARANNDKRSKIQNKKFTEQSLQTARNMAEEMTTILKVTKESGLHSGIGASLKLFAKGLED